MNLITSSPINTVDQELELGILIFKSTTKVEVTNDVGDGDLDNVVGVERGVALFVERLEHVPNLLLDFAFEVLLPEAEVSEGRKCEPSLLPPDGTPISHDDAWMVGKARREDMEEEEERKKQKERERGEEEEGGDR